MVLERGRHSPATSSFGSRRLLFANLKHRFLGSNCSSRYMFRIVKVIALALLAVYLLSYLFSGTVIIEDPNYGEITNHDVNTVEVEKICTKPVGLQSETCYSVVDIFHKEIPSSVQRAIYVQGFESEYDSVVQLIPPVGINTAESDSRMWRVNHTSLTTQYVAAMLTQMFAVSAVGMTDVRDDETSILVVGLGGGNFDMFLHRQRPKISITVVEIEPIVIHLAKKWFEVVDDAKRTTLTMDGIEAIKTAALEGTKYDAVVLDACDATKAMPCPAKTFLLQKNLMTIKSILKPMGVFVVNVLILDDRKINERLVEKTLTSQFPTCLKMQMAEELNLVFACLSYVIEPNTLLETQQMIEKQLVEASKNMGLSTVLHYSNMELLGNN